MSVINLFNDLKGGIQIFVKIHEGKIITLEVIENETFENIKLKIFEKSGISPDIMKLEFQGSVLKNDEVIGNTNISNQSVINMVQILKGGMLIFAKTIDGRIVSIELFKNDTIFDMKKKIQEKIGLAPDEMKLVFQRRILEDDHTIEDYKMANQSVINVVARPRVSMQIFAKTMDGKTVAFEVIKNDTIFDMKKKLQEKIGLAPDEMKLVFQGGILDDDHTIEDYKMANQSVINVVARPRGGMQIFAKTMDGNTVAFEVIKNDTIFDMKKKLQEKIGLAPDEMKVVFQGGILEDDHTIGYYQIAEKSVINVVDRTRGAMQIFVKTMDGIIVVEVFVNDTIFDFKKKLQEKTAFASDEMKLVYNGRYLDDDYTIGYYQIADKSVINVVFLLK